jgi:hypothetical protein
VVGEIRKTENPVHGVKRDCSPRKTAKTTPVVCTTETVMLPSDAAARLKNGSCEDDEPSQNTNRAAAYPRVSAPSLTHLRGKAAIASSETLLGS